MAAALVTGAVLTLAVLAFPFARFDNVALHLALETAEGLIAALLAYLMVKRYHATRGLQHVVLAWVFAVFGFVNLVMSAGPLVAEQERHGGWLTWAAVAARLVAGAALFAGAYAGRRPAPPPKVVLYRVLSATLTATLAVGLAASVAASWLADPVVPFVPTEKPSRPWEVGHPLVLGVQLTLLVLFSVAAVRFSRQGHEQGDELLRWLGAGAAFSAFARLHYFLFPSLYSNFVYSGDLLRLGAYVFFLVGAAREIDAYWRDQTRVAAVEERRRLARDLHDGLAQELAFIRSQTAAMAAGMAVPGMTQHLSAAAERALTESRLAVDALSSEADDESLADALVRAAEDVASRAGATVEVEADESCPISLVGREVLMRVAREATTNAVRHGQASVVSLRLAVQDDRLCLSVTDDGTGFDPTAARRGYGLRSMRERAAGLGGELRVTSAPGQGAVVEVDVPAVPGKRAKGIGVRG
ncbi:MAG: sensor histidine kinase [Actinomycetota bacterium]|nr:sensor histidine kinase [Actinomycetota bacterium]